jgi:endogenous inhibitor of DNA gyrase (YacG/DUF329 family)
MPIMICENCGYKHNGLYGSGRFCSSKCARGFSTKGKRSEINFKISKSLKGRGNGDVHLICEECQNSFTVDWKKRKQRFCSIQCSSIFKNRNMSKETKLKISNSVKIAHKEGRCVSWLSRKNLEPSYPETYFIRIFEN